MNWLSALMFGMMCLIMIALTYGFFPALFDSKQAEYSKECIARYSNGSNGSSNLSSQALATFCIIGKQYPEQLPDVKREISIKTIQILWFGDCKVLTKSGELLYSADDTVCMSQPNDNVTVYYRRTLENAITNSVYGA